MKFYKWLLRFIQIFIVLVVLPRVADFVAQLGPMKEGFDVHDLIRFAFAATLGLGTVATAYFSDETQPPEYDDEPQNPKERRRREREAVFYTAMLQSAPYARGAMYFFAFLDGSFNLADTVMGASANGLFDVGKHGQMVVVLYALATALFGISPTVLAIVLARVNSMVDRIPEGYERPVSKKSFDMLRTVMGNLGLREYRAGDAAMLLSPTEPEQLENEVRSSWKRTNRTNLRNNGSSAQREKIYEYINSVWINDGRVPGPTEIATEITCAKSYAHEVLTDWKQEHMETA